MAAKKAIRVPRVFCKICSVPDSFLLFIYPCRAFFIWLQSIEQNVPVRLNQQIALLKASVLEVVSRKLNVIRRCGFWRSIKQCWSIVLELQGPQTSEIRELRVYIRYTGREWVYHLDIYYKKKHSQENAADQELMLLIHKKIDWCGGGHWCFCRPVPFDVLVFSGKKKNLRRN